MTFDTQQTLDDLAPPDRLPFMPGIDGLRAIAVMAVLFYHAEFTWARGGFLGVEVFFVISGYLITSLLLVEWLRTGTIDLKTFWLRRARRLLPAVFLLLALVSLASIFLFRDTVSRMLADVVAASGYVTNWWLIVEDVSYFESFGRPPLLQHLWSLSVEEQFYVLWPLIFSFGMAMFAFKRRERTIRSFLALTVVGIILSTAWMAHLYVPFDDPSRVYYGTDTRAAGILVGVALALVWIPWRLPARISTVAGRVLTAGGLVALVALGWILVALDEFSPFLYQGGFLVTSLITAAVIAVTVHPAIGFGRVLERQPLKWIGTRSYGIYLWHWPIFMVTRPGFDISGNPYLLFVLRTALTFGIAELSYRLVEAPIRRHGFRTWMGTIRSALGVSSVRGATVMATAMLATFVLIGGGLVLGATRPPAVTIASQAVADGEALPDLTSGTANAPGVAAPAPAAVDAIPSEEESVEPQPPDGAAQALPEDQPASTEPTEESSVTAEPVAPDTTTTTLEMMVSQQAAEPTTVSIIGDSVVAGAQPAIEDIFGTAAIVDATVSRQFRHAEEVVRAMRSDDTLGDVVVIHLGTNGAFAAETFDLVMTELGDAHRVIVVNTKVPRRWETRVNATIADGLTRWPDVELVDWHTIAGSHPEWFADDQVHLNATGRAAYAELLAEVIGS